MGLFKKENCCLCGGKTGLLDKKCSEGKICKECRQKLSVWFDEYKSAAVSDLNAQIAQKDAEVEKAPALEFNKVFGETGCILINEKDRIFTVFADTSNSLFGKPRQVHSIEDVLDLRPDLISFDQVKDIEIDITEMTYEDQSTANSQNANAPKQYRYTYTFTLRFIIDHPYIKRAYLPLNKDAVTIKTDRRRVWTDPGRKLAAHLLNLPGLVKEDIPEIYDNDSLIHLFYVSPYERPDMSFGFKVTNANWPELQKYYYYLVMADQIRGSILGKD